MRKTPTLKIFWADTLKPLTKAEREAATFNLVATRISQNELQFIDQVSDRLVIVRGVSDARPPTLPEMVN